MEQVLSMEGFFGDMLKGRRNEPPEKDTSLYFLYFNHDSFIAEIYDFLLPHGYKRTDYIDFLKKMDNFVKHLYSKMNGIIDFLFSIQNQLKKDLISDVNFLKMSNDEIEKKITYFNNTQLFTGLDKFFEIKTSGIRNNEPCDIYSIMFTPNFGFYLELKKRTGVDICEDDILFLGFKASKLSDKKVSLKFFALDDGGMDDNESHYKLLESLLNKINKQSFFFNRIGDEIEATLDREFYEKVEDKPELKKLLKVYSKWWTSNINCILYMYNNSLSFVKKPVGLINSLEHNKVVYEKGKPKYPSEGVWNKTKHQISVQKIPK